MVKLNETMHSDPKDSQQTPAIRVRKGAWRRMLPDYEHHVHYYETDQMGCVHHSNYIE